MPQLNMERGIGRSLFEDYGQLLRDHLDEFTEGANLLHEVQLQVYADSAVATVAFVVPSAELREDCCPVVWLEPLTQDCPYTHGIAIVSPQSLRIVKPAFIERWTNLNAWLDSNEVIALVLNNKMQALKQESAT